MKTIKILFVADTHLGFDLPFRPRIERRRRGPDFFANFERALEPAFKGEVDAVVHGGDLLFRSKVPARLVEMAFEPLERVADKGTPVYLVPGNHERSAIPYRLLITHKNIHIFDKPRTFVLRVRGFTLALAGFPYFRDNVRGNFTEIIRKTGWSEVRAGARILCMHHCVEGAAVGPKNYTFRYNRDVVRIRDIPKAFTAVLSGHIHRFQVLTRDLRGKPAPVPVYYPGSIERTSFSEKEEEKGFLIIEIGIGEKSQGIVKQWEFRNLPARPMIQIEIQAAGLDKNQLETRLKLALESLPEDSVVGLKVHGTIRESALPSLNAASVRSLAPSSMNVVTTLADYRPKALKILSSRN